MPPVTFSPCSTDSFVLGDIEGHQAFRDTVKTLSFPQKDFVMALCPLPQENFFVKWECCRQSLIPSPGSRIPLVSACVSPDPVSRCLGLSAQWGNDRMEHPVCPEEVSLPNSLWEGHWQMRASLPPTPWLVYLVLEHCCGHPLTIRLGGFPVRGIQSHQLLKIKK